MEYWLVVGLTQSFTKRLQWSWSFTKFYQTPTSAALPGKKWTLVQMKRPILILHQKQIIQIWLTDKQTYYDKNRHTKYVKTCPGHVQHGTRHDLGHKNTGSHIQKNNKQNAVDTQLFGLQMHFKTHSLQEFTSNLWKEDKYLGFYIFTTYLKASFRFPHVFNGRDDFAFIISDIFDQLICHFCNSLDLGK